MYYKGIRKNITIGIFAIKMDMLYNVMSTLGLMLIHRFLLMMVF